jgi:aspartate carbamoyltransferase catalytic subunit
LLKPSSPLASNRKNSDLTQRENPGDGFLSAHPHELALAHEAAMIRLGGQVTGFSDAKMTRAGDFLPGIDQRYG